MTSKSRRPESRRRPRSKVSWPVIVEVGDRVLHGETLDVSPFGVKVRLEERLQDATLATLHLNPPNGDPLDVQAIVWRMDDDGPVFLFLKKAPAFLLRANDKQSSVPSVFTIMVVDDDPLVGAFARDALGVGYLVLFTDDPLEAVRMARNRPGEIDLLLVDVVMPLMDGRELARRTLELRPKMKVLFMSGFEVSGLRETGWECLAKPFGVTELIQKVADTVSPGKQASAFAAPPRPAGRPSRTGRTASTS